jgi:hypothetical protein
MAAQNAAREAAGSVKTCVSDLKASDDGRVVYARMWAADETDTAAKLNDQKPLAANERDALVRVHQSMLKCRQIIIQHDLKYAAWETPIWQDFYARADAIFTKTVSGEITVAQANKLSIESGGMLQSALARGNARAVAAADAQRQRASEAMLNAGTQLLASSQTHTTNCSWIGNTVSCTSR